MPPPATLDHSGKAFQLLPASGLIAYAEGVIAGSPGLRGEASYPGFRAPDKMPYPNGVIANRQRVDNNAFSVEKTGTTLTQGSSLRIATLGYPQ